MTKRSRMKFLIVALGMIGSTTASALCTAPEASYCYSERNACVASGGDPTLCAAALQRCLADFGCLN